MKSLHIGINNYKNQSFDFREIGCSPSLALEYIYDYCDDIEKMFDCAVDFVLEFLTIGQNQTSFTFHIDDGRCWVTSLTLLEF